jgi:hypothetical protein
MKEKQGKEIMVVWYGNLDLGSPNSKMSIEERRVEL